MLRLIIQLESIQGLHCWSARAFARQLHHQGAAGDGQPGRVQTRARRGGLCRREGGRAESEEAEKEVDGAPGQDGAGRTSRKGTTK